MKNYFIHWRLDDLEGYDEVKGIDAYGAKRWFEHKNPGVEVLQVRPE